MGDTKRLRRRKAKLWERQKGLCFWCEREMLFTIGRGGEQPSEVATIDHLRTRYASNRSEPPRDSCEERTVLACYRCNHKRGAEATAAVPVAELWRRAQSYPQEYVASLRSR